ncbi:hypothetical protein IPV69_02545 [Humisphaera borealis]|uniref:DUF7133 domain-containing protein n=1 Tax=Humisphaera borealis TaxID=2807512 RepID=A0A7M2X3L2_9BACT|nr:hypothetical protein IPV69_02545 [Humisphaera borealis]
MAAAESKFYRLVDVSLARSNSNSRDTTWKPGVAMSKAPVLEISGIVPMEGKRLAVTTRIGDVWMIDGAYDEPAELQYTRFATGLHEPLGLLRQGDALLTMQRSELTQLRDTDGDGAADEYLAAMKGWNVSGNYHEYAFGPKRDGQGNLWLALNVGMGAGSNNDKPWRGWAMRITPEGMLEPMCGGLRSPCALGANAAGDMFVSDQQGTWVATTPIHHLRKGAFYGNAETVKTFSAPGSPIKLSGPVPEGMPYPKALELLPELKNPAVWLPYLKTGQSSTDILLDDTAGKFGPFAGQLFVSDFTTASMTRVYLEKVNGVYQGACFGFREGFASALLRIAFGTDGSMFAGLSNRGWSSRGTAAYGLQRLVWTGKTPMEIKEMKAKPDGFELVFTKPVDRKTAVDVTRYSGSSYTYNYWGKYGSPEIDTLPLKIMGATVSDDGLSVRLKLDALRRYYVHELNVSVSSAEGEQVLHPVGYYTVNEIPK